MITEEIVCRTKSDLVGRCRGTEKMLQLSAAPLIRINNTLGRILVNKRSARIKEWQV